MKKLKTTACATLLLASTLTAAAQVSDIRDTDAIGYITRAEAMLNTGNAVGALDQLDALERLQMPLQAQQDLLPDMLWIRANAQLENDDKDCLKTAARFIELYGGSERAQQMRMLCGDWYYYHADYEQAARIYADVQSAALSPKDAEDVAYRQALTTLRLAHYDEAAEMFNALTASRAYSDPARFYLAYIDYIHGDYARARNGFEQYVRGYKADSNKGRSMVPTAPDASYYMAQIDFAQGNYADVAKEVPALVRNCNDPSVAAELNRICGESLYNIGEPDRAESYLARYLKHVGADSHPSSRYMMGVILYGKQEYAEASELFETVAACDDALGQSASLYLGQCEMKLGEPGAATVAFDRAYRMNYDPKVSESALYNYAALLSTGSSVPFGRSSVELLEQFVQKYPDSEFADKADEYLAGAYFNEKDYRRALQSIRRIANPSAAVLQAKQKILYELGVECIANGRSAEAIPYLTEAADMNNTDSRLATRSLLWLGDAYYNTAAFAKAAQNYNVFLQKAPKNDPNISLAEYDLAYTLYQQNKYAEARKHFESVLKTPGNLPKALVADARTRVADCLYINGDFAQAMDMYQQAMNQEAANADYAALQRANMLGLQGHNKEMIQALDNMMSKYPASAWIPDAMLEKARTYIVMGDDNKAIDTYTQLLKRYPQSPQSRRGMLLLAMTYADVGKTDQAENCYRQIISTWPTSDEAQTANQDLRNMYATTGRLDEYASFLKSIPGAPNIDEDEIERLTYDAAESAVLLDADDIALMRKYIERYPDGRYLDRALYSIAQSQYAAGRHAEALRMLESLNTKRPDSSIAPEATLMRAQIYEDTDMGSRHDALNAWRELLQNGGADYYAEACAGIMRNTDSPAERVEYANRLSHTTGLSAEEMEEAIFYRALGLLNQQQYTAAVNDLKQLAANPKSLYGSRASIELADYYIARQQWSDAEKLLQAYVDSGTPHHYWLARGYIDLADTYYAQGRKTLARQYIKSLEENYPGSESDIAKMIQDRLAKWK